MTPRSLFPQPDGRMPNSSMVKALVPDHLLLDLPALERSGFSRGGVYRAVAAGRLVAAWPGIFLEKQEWGGLTPREQVCAVHQAFRRSSSVDFAFSHRSAAVLLGLGTIGRTPRIHVAWDPRPGISTPRVSRHELPVLEGAVVELRTGLAATSLALTGADCARTMPLGEAVAVLDQVLARGVPKASVMDALEASSVRGRRAAVRALELADPLSDSVLESLVRVVLATAGIEPPVLQHRVIVGGRVRYLDFAWPSLRLGLEADGKGKYYDYRPTDEALVAEREREKDLMAEDWMLLRTDWAETVHRSHDLAARVRGALERRRRWMRA